MPVAVTVPPPTVTTVSVASASKRAPMVAAAVRSRLHEAVPVHAPLQPRKVDPAAGAAERPTVGDDIAALQVAPHAMPDGDDVTVPVPLPLRVTVTMAVP